MEIDQNKDIKSVLLEMRFKIFRLANGQIFVISDQRM